MNENQLMRALGLALEIALEALKTINQNNLINLKLQDILMTNEEAKANLQQILANDQSSQALIVSVANAQAEAFAEINARIVEQQATIDALLAAAPGLDPEIQALIDSVVVSTTATNSALAPIQTAAQALADIVPNAPAPVDPVA